MRFGNFLAPFHPTGQNPTLAIERDLDLIVAMDRLGFHEAWIGEHHSAGFEIIASPEVMIAVAAERTKHIKLGTGVNSLPYHNPLMLADRMVLLDHLTRGRVMLGCGPGQLTSDAHMLGIPADDQRPRMEQCLDAIMRLLRGETVTMHTDGFTLQDARLQLAPYSDPCFDVAVAASFSPTGPRGAGRHGVGMLSIAATARQGMDLLAQHWSTWEEVAAEHGHIADRSKWRLVGPMHLAETREQAERDVEYGIVEFSQYFSHLLPGGPVQGDTVEEILANNNQSGFAVIGTPADAVAKMRSSSRRATADSARSCYWTTTGPGRQPRCTATNCSRSTSCRTSPGNSRVRPPPATGCAAAGPCSWSAPRTPSERRSRTTRRSGPRRPRPRARWARSSADADRSRRPTCRRCAGPPGRCVPGR